MLIDEYDTPFLEAHMNGFYNEIHNELAVMMSSALKGNQFLHLALLTGIQRVAKENIFSGLNNLLVCTVNQPENSFYEMPGASSLWGLLLNSGMITIENELEQGYYRVRIPNVEVKTALIDFSGIFFKILLTRGMS